VLGPLGMAAAAFSFTPHVAVCCCPLPPAEKPDATDVAGRVGASFCLGGVDRLCTGQELVGDTGRWFLAAEAL